MDFYEALDQIGQHYLAILRGDEDPEQKGAKLRLEEKIARQRAHINRLEECRRFERETEALLVAAILDAIELSDEHEVRHLLMDAFLDYGVRKGPRSTEEAS